MNTIELYQCEEIRKKHEKGFKDKFVTRYDTQLEKLVIIRKGSDILNEQDFFNTNRYIKLHEIVENELGEENLAPGIITNIEIVNKDKNHKCVSFIIIHDADGKDAICIGCGKKWKPKNKHNV